MKRVWTMLAVTLALTSLLCVSASASSYDSVAQELSAIGMFRGTDQGFELDRAPTRAEAAIMLVRLYGAEEAALAAYEAGEISHPFTDVSKFNNPYVAWLYTNGLTKGATETTFASRQPCTAQNYVTFLLRALGYQDGKDFQYADALTFAQEQGFYDPGLVHETFLRDDLAALTYQALAADMAEGDTYLLASLMESGAIDNAAAKPMKQKMETYRTIQAACSTLDSTRMDADIITQIDTIVRADGLNETSSSTSTISMQLIADDPEDIQLAYTLTAQGQGMDMTMGMWLKDGWEYLAMEVDGEAMRIKAPYEDLDAAMEDMDVMDVSSMDVSGLALIDAITTKSVSGGTAYTLTLSDGLMDSAMDFAAAEDMEGIDMEIPTMDVVYTLSRSGQLKEISTVFSIAAMTDVPLEDGTMLPTEVIYDYDMTISINAIGKNVRITWPDFSTFQEDPFVEEY